MREIQIIYRLMPMTHAMTVDTHFNTLSNLAKQNIIEHLLDKDLTQDIVIAEIYGTRLFWIEVQDFLKLITK